jgi:RES domain-containing protein
MSAVEASTVEAFTRILRATQSNPLEGIAFRAVQEKYRESPLSAVGSIRVGGRYNPKGMFEALYLAETAQSALSEVAFGITSGGKFINTPHSPYIVLSITFFLQKVLRLEEQLTRLGLIPEQLAMPWRPIQQSGGLALTQALGIAARETGLEGLVVPSRFSQNIHNLVVFVDNLEPTSSIEVVNPAGGLTARLEKRTQR